MQFSLFAVYRCCSVCLLALAGEKSVRLLFLIGGHVHLCVYLLFFCSFAYTLRSVSHYSAMCFFSAFQLTPARVLYRPNLKCATMKETKQNPTTLCTVDNVCLFCVRAFTSKIQNTFFDKRLEKLIGLCIVFIPIFFWCVIPPLRKTMPVKWVGWVKCSTCQNEN